MSTLVRLDQVRPAGAELAPMGGIPDTGAWMTRDRSLGGVNLQTSKNRSWTSGQVTDCRRTRLNCTDTKSHGSGVDHLRIVS